MDSQTLSGICPFNFSLQQIDHQAMPARSPRPMALRDFVEAGG
jgi:hypothetical protein